MSQAPPDSQLLPLLAWLPAPFRPYAQLARLDRPIGWWLLLLPCWWSAALAAKLAGALPNLWHMLLFLVGAIVMRGAGSTWNDISDRHLDAKVARTRARPLPAGLVSVRKALLFMLVQLLIGFLVLISFNAFAILVGLLSILPVILYPFAKRVSNYPQFLLGLTFAWGALMGFAASLGTMPQAGLLLYAGAIAWVIGYDTIYALQDLEDDAIVGIGSTALATGEKVRGFVGLNYAVAALLIGLALWHSGSGLFGYLGWLAFALHLVWQVRSMDRDDPVRAMRLFRANRDAGLLLFAGLALDTLM